MAIGVQCSACGNSLNAPDHLAGALAKCPVCSARVQVPRPQPAPVAPLDGRASRWLNKTWRKNAILAAVLSVVSLAVTIAPRLARHAELTQPPSVHEEFRSAAQELIGQDLKAPATAIFAPDDDWEFEEIDKNTLRMKAWVDAQNPFGVYLRHRFVAIVTLNAKASKWLLRYLKYDNSDKAIGEYLYTPEEQDLLRELVKLQEGAEKEKRRAIDEAKAREASLAAESERKRQAMYETAVREQQEREKALANQRRTDEHAMLMAELVEQGRDNKEADREPQQPSFDASYRVWPSAKNIRAKIVSYGNGTVTVETSSGARSKLNFESLDDSEKEFVSLWRRNRDRGRD